MRIQKKEKRRYCLARVGNLNVYKIGGDDYKDLMEASSILRHLEVFYGDFKDIKRLIFS